ncbi:hypothetical protein U1Q18_001688 [Sarracenia purpurea var. burkii]
MANPLTTKMVLSLVVFLALSMNTEARVLKRKSMESHDLFHELGFDSFKLQDGQTKYLDGSIVQDRLVPSGPNPEEPPSIVVDRLVPSGPNPEEPPSVVVDRLVPSGPNPEEPPSTPTVFT